MELARSSLAELGRLEGNEFVNKAEARKLIDTVVRLVPLPKVGSTYIPKTRNQWLVLSEAESGKGLVLLNSVTEHKFTLEFALMRNFQEPDSLILRGQVFAEEHGTGATITPFADLPDQITIDDELRQRVKDLLGMALHCGENILRMNSSKIVEQEWSTATHQLILDAFGEGEASLFGSAHGLSDLYVGKSKSMQIRIRRLIDLIPRADTLSVRPTLDLSQEKDKKLREQYAAFEHC